MLDDVKKAYAHDARIVRLMDHLKNPSRQTLTSLPAPYRSSIDRYQVRDGLVYYLAITNDTARVVVSSHDLQLRIMFEYHDASTVGHRGREKTYRTVSRDFHWPRQYQFVRKYVRACEVCQRV